MIQGRGQYHGAHGENTQGQRKRPVLFLIPGHDYLMADGLEVDVPVFIHRPEWLEPR